MHAFRQVDVFTDEFRYGNPGAVVHDADDLSDEDFAAFARWTNLSETTFLLTPTDPAADYRLRSSPSARELPFAGHPTLGSARAWLDAGGVPKAEDIVQHAGRAWCASGVAATDLPSPPAAAARRPDGSARRRSPCRGASARLRRRARRAVGRQRARLGGVARARRGDASSPSIPTGPR